MSESASNSRVSASVGFLLILLVASPILIQIWFKWRVFYTVNTLKTSAIAASMLAIPALYPMHLRIQRLSHLGVNFNARYTGKSKLPVYLALLFVLWASLHCLFLTGLLAELQTHSSKSQVVIVEGLDTCSGKCSGCLNRVTVAGLPGIKSAKVCATSQFMSQARVGDSVKVYGHFSERASYVSELLLEPAG